jgi:hypothetical protein
LTTKLKLRKIPKYPVTKPHLDMLLLGNRPGFLAICNRARCPQMTAVGASRNASRNAGKKLNIAIDERIDVQPQTKDVFASGDRYEDETAGTPHPGWSDGDDKTV